MSRRTPARTRPRRRLLIALVAVALASVAVTTWAFWSGSGSGAAAGTVATFDAATMSVPASTSQAVTVTWTAQASLQPASGGNDDITYSVERRLGTGAWAAVAGGGCAGVKTYGVTSCSDVPPATGSYGYRTVATYRQWTATSSAAGPVSFTADSAPVAVADAYSVNENATLAVAAPGVLTNDTDPNDDPLTAILVSGVANGALTLSANGSFVYTPGTNFAGSDSFTYKASDGIHSSNTVTVTLTVTAVNDAPVNSIPADQQTPRNTNRTFSSANNNLISISDPDAGGATVEVRLTATSGTVTLPVLTGLTFSVGDGTSDATMTFTGTIATINLRLNGAIFIPATDFSGAATLQIVTSDLGNTGGAALTDTDTVTVNVNSLGIFTANQDIGVPPGTAGTSSYSSSTYTVAGSGADIWDNADHFQFVSRPVTGDVRLTAKVVSQVQTPTTSNPAKAGVMFRETLAAGSIHGMMDLMKANGSEFHWRLTTNGPSAATTVTPGIAAPYWVRLTRVGNILTGERSPDGVTWTQQGATQSIPMTSAIYAGLAVSAVDATKLNTATFDNVALTTPPTAVADAYTTNEGATLNVAASGVLANDTDPESNALTAVLVSGTAGLTLNANGSFAYVPPAGFSGTASFTYRATDGVFNSNTVTVTLTVNPANAAPSFTKGANQSTSENAGAQTVDGWATAISQGTGDSGQLVDFVVTNDANALFSVQPAVNAAGTLTYTPAGTSTGVATVSVRLHDNGGTANGGVDTSAVQTFTITVTADTTGPAGGSVDASGLVGTGSRYAASTTLSLDLAKGTDPSGVAATGNLLKRATATLTSGGTANGTCGTFGSYTTITGGTDPASPASDLVTDQACYRYQYVVLDTLGNATTYTSPDIKVDLTAPAAPTLAHSAFTNTYWSGGATVYYRSAASSGSFTTTSTATDTASGIASHAFPALGTNWTSTPGALGVNTYSWSGAPQAPGAKNVTATNHAGVVSGTTSFTPTADDTAPTAGTVTPPDVTQSSTSVSVAYTTGTDGGSGLGTRLLQRQAALLTGTTCGTYGGWATAATNPGSSPFSDTVTSGYCYRYQYVVSDNVGNQDTATSANVVKVAAAYAATVSGTTGLHSYWRMGDAVGSTVMDDITTTNNNGTFVNAPTRGVVGALNGDANTAVLFNGSTQYATAVRQLGGNFSLEFWVKSTQSYAADPACIQWWQGAALIDAEVGGNFNDFGVSMCSGKIIAGVGFPDVSIVSAATYNDGNWHHVVFTRTQISGAMALYVDGSSVGTATGSTAALTSAANLVFARTNAGSWNFFAGTLDEAALYNTALSGATVTAHYNAR